MHEWSLAEAIVTTLKKYKNQGKIIEVGIRIGILQQIDLEVFKSALQELLNYNSFSNVKINLEFEDAYFECNVCHYKWSFSEIINKLDENSKEMIHFIPELVHAFVKCPNCKSIDYTIKGGRGVWISYIKIQK